jgi:hypothetical protein
VAGPSLEIWPVRTHGRGTEEKLGEEGANRWAPSVSDGGVVTGWHAGSRVETG